MWRSHRNRFGKPRLSISSRNTNELRHDKPELLVWPTPVLEPTVHNFITHNPTPHLDGSYNIFGQVLYGQEIVDAIGGLIAIKETVQKRM